jgi:hypothetical protein
MMLPVDPLAKEWRKYIYSTAGSNGAPSSGAGGCCYAITVKIIFKATILN